METVRDDPRSIGREKEKVYIVGVKVVELDETMLNSYSLSLLAVTVILAVPSSTILPELRVFILNE